MVLPDDGGDYRQTTLAFFWKQVTVNIVCMHEHDMRVWCSGHGKGRQEQDDEQH